MEGSKGIISEDASSFCYSDTAEVLDSFHDFVESLSSEVRSEVISCIDSEGGGTHDVSDAGSEDLSIESLFNWPVDDSLENNERNVQTQYKTCIPENESDEFKTKSDKIENVNRCERKNGDIFTPETELVLGEETPYGLQGMEFLPSDTDAFEGNKVNIHTKPTCTSHQENDNHRFPTGQDVLLESFDREPQQPVTLLHMCLEEGKYVTDEISPTYGKDKKSFSIERKTMKKRRTMPKKKLSKPKKMQGEKALLLEEKPVMDVQMSADPAIVISEDCERNLDEKSPERNLKKDIGEIEHSNCQELTNVCKRPKVHASEPEEADVHTFANGRDFNSLEIVCNLSNLKGKDKGKGDNVSTANNLLNINIKQCKLCPKIAHSARAMREHIYMKHKVSTPQLFKCDLCSKEFKLFRDISRHKQNVHAMELGKEKVQHICKICGKNISNAANLRVHLDTHKEVKRFVCELCGCSFSQLFNLNNHLKTHNGKNKAKGLQWFECHDCDKKFKKKTDLNKHLRSHTGVSIPTCKECGKTFVSLSKLHTHEAVHLDVKPYACNICPLTFSQAGILRKHMQNKHSVDTSFKCEKCKMTFVQGRQLEKHIATHHKREN